MSMFIPFPDAEALVRDLRADAEDRRGEARRFRARLILVPSPSSWNALLRALRGAMNPAEIRLSKGMRSPDTAPRKDAWRILPKDLPEGRALLLTPLMEDLRFRADDAEITGVLKHVAEWTDGAADGGGRIYVPLLCRRSELERRLAAASDRFRQGLLPPIRMLPEEPARPPQFVMAPILPARAAETGMRILESFSAYLKCWEDAAVPDGTVLVRTGRVAGRPEGERGPAEILPDAGSVVRRLLPGIRGAPDDAPEALLEALLRHARRDDADVGAVAARIMGLAGFSPSKAVEALLARDGSGGGRDAGEAALIRAAWRHAAPADGLAGALLPWADADADTLRARLRDAVLEGGWTPDALRERRDLLIRLAERDGWDAPPRDFLEGLRALPARTRLPLLVASGRDERNLVVETAGECLRDGMDQDALREALADVLPVLADYLAPLPDGAGPPGLAGYIRAFRGARLRNEMTEELAALQADLLSGAATLPHAGDTRDAILREPGMPGRTFWLDGFGVEWLGVAEAALRRAGMAFRTCVGRANLPTVTEANRGWEHPDDKTGELDHLGHDPSYAFPASFLRQLEAAEDFVRRRIGGLRGGAFGADVRSVVLTGDHGLTPAVLHPAERTAPEGFEILRGGRALRRLDPDAPWPDGVAVHGDRCHISGAGRFRGRQGAPRGTIHGGASPEEIFVPVIILNPEEPAAARKDAPPPAAVPTSWPESLVLSPMGTADVLVGLSGPATGIRLEWNGGGAEPADIRNGEALFRVPGLRLGRTAFAIRIGGRTVKTFEADVRGGGLEDNDMGI